MKPAKRVRQMGKRLAGLLSKLRPDVDLRDIHLYGGGLILAGGLWIKDPAYALCAFGGLLILIGFVVWAITSRRA